MARNSISIEMEKSESFHPESSDSSHSDIEKAVIHVLSPPSDPAPEPPPIENPINLVVINVKHMMLKRPKKTKKKVVKTGKDWLDGYSIFPIGKIVPGRPPFDLN